MPTFMFPVKVVVGRSRGREVAPGEYWTAVNVHNPSYRTVEFSKKVAVAFPKQAGPVSGFEGLVLRGDEALEIDREDILRQAATDEFVKGFVVIMSPQDLDVVAVYTASPDGSGVSTIHTERVRPRVIRLLYSRMVRPPAPKATASRKAR
jgi:hypothetical protein